MPNWKIHNGDFYVAKSGSLDSRTPGDANQPFRTVQQALDAAAQETKSPVSIVVGAGRYAEDLFFSGSQHVSISGDGKVILGPQRQGGVLLNQRGGNFRLDLNHIEVEQTNALIAGSSVQVGLSWCILNNVTLQFNDRQSDFHRCTIRNSQLTAAPNSTAYAHISKCTFIATRVSGLGNSQEGLCSIIDSFFDEFSRIDDASSSRIGQFETNNFRFPVGRATTGFEMVIDGRSITDLTFLQSTFPEWNRLSMAADPLFNSSTFEDMTLSSTSPMAFKGSDGEHIGAWDIAYAYGGASSELDPRRVTLTGVEYASGSYRLMSGATEGTIETEPIDLQSKQTLGKIRLFATQTYPADVIDSSNRMDSPNRQTFEMRYGDDPRSMGNYLVFEWDEIPTINPSSGVSRIPIGNGEPGFNVQAAMPVEAQYVQLRVTLRNNGIEA